jgi:protein SCO1/2
VGPDLLSVTRQREGAWLTQYMLVQDQTRAEHDPIATALSAQYQHVLMPNLGLGEGDVAALLIYLEAQHATPRQ